jgi:hypothetical protein
MRNDFDSAREKNIQKKAALSRAAKKTILRLLGGSHELEIGKSNRKHKVDPER